MPPKVKEQKKTGKPAAKGAPGAKDYLPPDSKPSRDPLAAEDWQPQEVKREHPLLPQKIYPIWPSDQEVEVRPLSNFSFFDNPNFQKTNFDLESTSEPFKDESVPAIELPPSFAEMDQHIRWLRPREYLQQVFAVMEAKNQREARRGVFKARRSSTRLVGLVGVGEEAKEAAMRDQPSITESAKRFTFFFLLCVVSKK